MPRKTRSRSGCSATARPRFNEAAARCRGKRELRGAVLSAAGQASMRPRPDAAENLARTEQAIAAAAPLQ